VLAQHPGEALPAPVPDEVVRQSKRDEALVPVQGRREGLGAPARDPVVVQGQVRQSAVLVEDVRDETRPLVGDQVAVEMERFDVSVVDKAESFRRCVSVQKRS